MTAPEVIAQLRKMGTAQNRKVYARHGVTGPMFGVSYANLGKLQKKIKLDHDLAKTLWETGNRDGRVLAAKIADPARIKVRQVDRWVRESPKHVINWAVAAAKRIGKVEVDHGETGCKTPDAAAYITKTVAHRRKKKARK